MITIRLAQARLKVWSGYTANKSGYLPSRMSWLEPEAAAAVTAMQEASDWRFEFTDGYRSPMYQLQCIENASAKKRRLYAPPTKSGHNWGWSLDVAVKETLANFRASSNPEIKIAGQSRDAMARFMAQFGFTGIRSENWHFNHLGQYRSTVAKINAVYGSKFVYDDAELQRQLNAFIGAGLKIDGDAGKLTRAATSKAQRRLRAAGVKATGIADDWTRRLLAGMTMRVEKL
jgi:D-alanyl-D-alanine dipeptidase